MKMKLSLFFLLCLSNLIFSQRFKIIEGDLKNLKGITSYQVQFNYDKVAVHGFDSEEDFLKDKIEKERTILKKLKHLKEIGS